MTQETLYGYVFHTNIFQIWNKLSQDVRSKPSIASFLSALLKLPGPVKNNFWAMAIRQ